MNTKTPEISSGILFSTVNTSENRSDRIFLFILQYINLKLNSVKRENIFLDNSAPYLIINRVSIPNCQPINQLAEVVV